MAKAITQADVLVFIGYRAPPSDPHSLKTITDAISSNPNPNLRLHTVLGPPRHDSARLLKLLRHALYRRKYSPLQKRRLWQQDLLTQDFLTVVTPESLIDFEAEDCA
jgi:hypothetical protein